MKRRGEFDVIVVGAGIVGSALALALARDGFSVALVEARPPAPWRREDEVDLRVVAVAPDAHGLLDRLGVWTSISDARVSPYRRMRVRDALAPGELVLDAAEQGNAALGWIVENKLIQHALWQAIAAHPDIRTYCPARVDAFSESDERIAATLDDGLRLVASVLVAAEGGESSIRERLGIAFRGRDYGQRGVVAHVTTERSHEDTAWQRFVPGGPLAFLPLADKRCSIVWSLPDAEAERVLALDDAAFCAELGAASDFRLGCIVATTPRAAFPLRLRLADRYVAGRAVLAGDSAHLVHPLAGQGMNLGLRDVATLCRVLVDARAAASDIGAAHVLRRYERERRSHDTLAARGFDLIDRMFRSESLPLATLRGLALEIPSRVPFLRDAIVRVAAGKAAG